MWRILLVLLPLVTFNIWWSEYLEAHAHMTALAAAISPTNRRHGWFEVIGLQTGEHTLKTRLGTLIPEVRQRAKGATILDLGCAEGLISMWLMDNCGAKQVHGLEIHDPYLERARELAGRRNVAFHHVDLNYLALWAKHNPNVLHPRYDIVLALCIAQKMAEPERFLEEAASMCSDLLVVETPGPDIIDERSGKKVVNITTVMAPLGFTPIYSKDGCNTEKGYTYRACYRRMV